MIRFYKRRRKAIALFFVTLILTQVLSVPVAQALTGGPSQPEVQSFKPAGVTEMVDLFTGDFSYNIPLFELPGPNGGYPFNLSYQSGIGMDQEASWVGLGWSMQPGAITRQMRGLPDEFKGDMVSTKMSIKPSITVGLGVGGSIELFGGALGLGMGLSVYSNNYKGTGYKIDASLGIGASTGGGMTAGLNIGASLDSKEGVGINPTLSLGSKVGQVGLGAGYNSKQGLTTVTLTTGANVKNIEKKLGVDFLPGAGDMAATLASTSASLYLAHPSYTPQITMPMNNISLSLTLSVGGEWWGIYGKAYVNGYFTRQKLDADARNLSTKGYGYLNYQYAGIADLLDYNREKDGMVSKETPNLAIPSMTYDIYNVSGQGIGMMYRPIRNDHGIIYDQETSSVSNAVGVGVDIGPAATKIGINLNLNHSKSTSGLWTHNNDMRNRAVFNSKQKNYLYEPWQYKVHGEHTSENIKSLDSLGGTSAVRVQLTGPRIDPVVSTLIEGSSLVPTQAPRTSPLTQIRKQRTHSVEAHTNAEILKSGGDSTLLPEYNVAYKQYGSETLHLYDRTDASTLHHFAGYTALNGEGLRYVYGLPAYNLKQEDFSYSAERKQGQTRAQADPGKSADEPSFELSHTDKFFKRIAIPKFPHSYMLTAVLGPDYVDVTNNGVTPDDLGYWVKFTYTRTSSASNPYKWRDPYTMAHYNEGWKTDPRDDKGSFTYGEKEIWYLSRAETKSHIAEFTIEERQDAKGVTKRLQQYYDEKGAPVFALSSIKLYARTGDPDSPIKVTRFEYDYSLCPGVENSETGEGKLTLKKLWFEYGGSTRGSLNPYQFTYNNGTPETTISYDINSYDRWGNYKPHPFNEPLFNNDFPYTQQDPLLKNDIDSYAAAWSLKEIKLPSGGSIEVSYESDDYAYVQDQTATQMVEIVDPSSPLDQTPGETYSLDGNDCRIKFKLEKPLVNTLNSAEQTAEVKKYLDTKSGQLFCKLLIDLRKIGEGDREYIKGYVDIDYSKPMTLVQQTTGGDFVYGIFYVKAERSKHPFAMRAWQHLRVNQPDMTNSGKRQEPASSNDEMVNQIKGLGSVWTQVRQMFEGFYDYCDDMGWGEHVTTRRSWIRLSSPDKVKYGGGLRVKQLTMKDNWQGSDEGVYGQIYEYTTKESSTGPTISSGVASYEPIVGGEENAVRYAKPYVQSAPLIADNNLFFEYPINESYYPSANVGYSKVTVMSLPSAVQAGKSLATAQSSFPAGTGVNFGTSGRTVHEFFTAKDFPVITDETEKGNLQYKLNVPIPLIGSLSIMKLASNQGYSIVTNDMHGKQKKVSAYRQTKEGTFEDEPMSYVEYKYLTTKRLVTGKYRGELENVFKDNGDGTLGLLAAGDMSNPAIAKFYLAQESELFHDMRSFVDRNWEGGAKINIDIVYIPIAFIVVPIPVFTVWPSISASTQQLHTTTTNKIIFRSGILTGTEAYDGQSRVVTKNLKWDKFTGQPVLTSTTNNFDAQLYTFTQPAFKEYQGMGGAYQNIGLTFSINNLQQDPYKDDLYAFNPTVDDDLLRAGDEMLLYSESSEFEMPLVKVIYIGKDDDGDNVIYSPKPLTQASYDSRIVRSGYRNQLMVAAGSITALTDPSEKVNPVTYSKKISIPSNE